MVFYLQSMHSRMYVEVKGSEQDSPVIMSEFHGRKGQQWKYEDGRIVSKLNNSVLGCAEDGKFVITSEPLDTPRQKWAFGEDLTIVNDLGQALDVRGGSKEAGAEVIVWPKHGQDNQKFRVVPKNKPKN